MRLAQPLRQRASCIGSPFTESNTIFNLESRAGLVDSRAAQAYQPRDKEAIDAFILQRHGSFEQNDLLVSEAIFGASLQQTGEFGLFLNASIEIISLIVFCISIIRLVSSKFRIEVRNFPFDGEWRTIPFDVFPLVWALCGFVVWFFLQTQVVGFLGWQMLKRQNATRIAFE